MRMCQFYKHEKGKDGRRKRTGQYKKTAERKVKSYDSPD